MARRTLAEFETEAAPKIDVDIARAMSSSERSCAEPVMLAANSLLPRTVSAYKTDAVPVAPSWSPLDNESASRRLAVP